MSILDRFKAFFSKPASVPCRQPAATPELSWLTNDIKDGEDPFAAAFRQVMQGVSMQAPLQAEVARLLRKNLNNGRQQGEELFMYLLDKEWSWPDLVAWQQYFQTVEDWPCMWIGNIAEEMSREGILRRCPAEGVTPWELARCLDKKSLQVGLKKLDLLPDPKAKVAELRKTARELSVETLCEALPEESVASAMEKVHSDLLWSKCILLAHSITHRYCVLKNLEYMTPTPQTHRPFHTTCPIEKIFHDKWKRGELFGLPPFFPGDRTSFLLRKSARHFDEL